MRRALALTLLVLLAGCSDAAKEDPADSTTGTGTSTGGLAPGSTNGTAAGTAPQWNVGQAWTWRVQSGTTANTYEATSVVLAADGASYDVGAADTTDAMLLYPFHLVGFGPV